MNIIPTPPAYYTDPPPAYYPEAPPTYEDSESEHQVGSYLPHGDLADTSAPPTEPIAVRSVSCATSSAFVKSVEEIPDINSLSISDENTSNADSSEEPIKLNDSRFEATAPGTTVRTDQAGAGSSQESINNNNSVGMWNFSRSTVVEEDIKERQECENSLLKTFMDMWMREEMQKESIRKKIIAIRSTPKSYTRLSTPLVSSSGKVVNRIPTDAINILECTGLIRRNQSGNPEFHFSKNDFGGEM